MTSVIETGLNTTDNATVDVVTINNTTSTTLIAANPLRLDLTIDNGDNIMNMWVKLQAASVDDNKEWFFVLKGKPWIMSEHLKNAIFTGEVSGILNMGGTIDVQVIETTRDPLS